MSLSGIRVRSRAVVLTLTTLGTFACNGTTDVPSPTSYSIQLSHDTVNLMVPPGEPRSVVVTATVRTGSGDIVSPAAVSWGTDSPGVATVTQTGTVTAVSEGRALLRARYRELEANAVIMVTAPITFSVTGSMATTRIGHTATLLPDGKVLITGGRVVRSDGLGPEGVSAELYDPASGTFARTGDMTIDRSGHSATLLPNGKVLIAGGTAGNSVSTNTAELYDPATGTFSRTGDMRLAQSFHEATLLNTGKVLVTGGMSCCAIAATPELYDPATGVFTTTSTYAGMDPQRETPGFVGTRATLLLDGRVFITAEPETQVYDPVTGNFSRTGTMITGAGILGIPQYIAGQTATLLNDGRVLLTGGEHEDIGRFKTAETYNPTTGTFVKTGDMAFVRDGHTATLLRDGTVLISGGESVAGCAVLSLGSAEIYDPLKGSFVSVGRMNVRREFHTATQLTDGRVLVTGGLTFDGGLCGPVSVVRLSSAELYVPRN